MPRVPTFPSADVFGNYDSEFLFFPQVALSPPIQIENEKKQRSGIGPAAALSLVPTRPTPSAPIGRGGAQGGFDVPGDTGFARSLPETQPSVNKAARRALGVLGALTGAPFGLAAALSSQVQSLTGVPAQLTSAKIGLQSKAMQDLQGLEAAARSLAGKDISGPVAGIAGPVSGAARSVAGKVGGTAHGRGKSAGRSGAGAAGARGRSATGVAGGVGVAGTGAATSGGSPSTGSSGVGSGQGGAPGGDAGGPDSGGSGGSGSCFAPGSMVVMRDMTEKPIETIELGDDTLGGRVTSVITNMVDSSDWFEYRGVYITGSHAVKEDIWRRIQDSPLANKMLVGGELSYNLATTKNRIFIKDLEGQLIEFADYDELDLDDPTQKRFFAALLAGLNKQ